jgi:transposase-like protein
MCPVPRIPRVPLTSNVPEACPHCGGRNLTRRGTRKKKLEIVQLWRCASCKRVFTPGPAALHNKTYPLRMILSALTDYNLGYTLAQTAARLQKKAHRHVSPSTITSWLDEYKQHCTYRRRRAEGLARFPAVQTIRSIKLYHRQIYGYAFHRPKLEFLRNGSLDDKRAGDTRFAPLADFLESIPTTCPHDLFRRDDDPKARASQATPAWAHASRIVVNSKRNGATETASLIIPAVGSNKLRHETLQRFMLANDSVTVAIEIPIWLDEQNIAALENPARHRARAARGSGRPVDHRTHRFPAGAEWCSSHLGLQARRAHQQADRTAHHLRAGPHTSRARPQTLRHQVRVVQ